MEEIEDILNDINQMIETEAESELMAACHTNVLLLQQIFVQAQKWHLDLGKNNIKMHAVWFIRNTVKVCPVWSFHFCIVVSYF